MFFLFIRMLEIVKVFGDTCLYRYLQVKKGKYSVVLIRNKGKSTSSINRLNFIELCLLLSYKMRHSELLGAIRHLRCAFM